MKVYSPAIFIDRDGTINKDVPYCSCPEEFELFDGVGEAINNLNRARFKIVVITNQSGIARGYFSEIVLQNIHKKMKDDLALFNARIDAIYYCPHHPVDKCSCRKPKPGLILQAAGELSLDLKKSFMIGDSLTDMEAGKRAGCKTILVNQLGNHIEDASIDYICENLSIGVKWIIEVSKY